MGADGKWEISMNTPMGAQAGTLDLKEDGSDPHRHDVGRGGAGRDGDHRRHRRR